MFTSATIKFSCTNLNLQSLFPKYSRFGVLAVSTLHKCFTASTEYNPNTIRIYSYQFRPKQVYVRRNNHTFTQTFYLLTLILLML
jgi:hypothetical protein